MGVFYIFSGHGQWSTCRNATGFAGVSSHPPLPSSLMMGALDGRPKLISAILKTVKGKQIF
jgi:hypothetical protein